MRKRALNFAVFALILLVLSSTILTAEALFFIENFSTVPQKPLPNSMVTINVMFTLPPTAGNLVVSNDQGFLKSLDFVWSTDGKSASTSFVPPLAGEYSAKVVASYISPSSSEFISIAYPIEVGSSSGGSDNGGSGGCNSGAGSVTFIFALLSIGCFLRSRRLSK